MLLQFGTHSDRDMLSGLIASTKMTDEDAVLPGGGTVKITKQLFVYGIWNNKLILKIF